MSNLRKISIIIAASIVSILLLIVFILFNFPYNSVIKRIDFYLSNNYSTSLTVQNIRYRFPVKFLLEDMRLVQDEGPFAVHIERVLVKLQFFNFSKIKIAEIAGTGVDVNTDPVELSIAKISVLSGFRLSYLIREGNPDAVDFINLRTGGLKIDRLFLSGFEFSSFKIPLVDFSLINTNGEFIVEKGLIKSDLFNSEVSGGFNFELIDGKIVLTLSNEFYKQYSHLKNIVDSISDNGVLTVTIKGSMKKPAVKFL